MADLPVELLHQLFEADFEKGIVIWMARPVSMFASERSCKSWNSKHAGHAAAAHDNGQGYLAVRVFDKPRKLHRIIFALRHGHYPEAIDHINGDRADNRICNLRSVTPQQNSQNLRLSKQSKSGEPGVYWNEKTRKWQARVSIGRRSKYLGNYTEKDEAVAAARAARVDLGYHPNHGRQL